MRPMQAQPAEGDIEQLLKDLIEQGLSLAATAPTQNRTDSEAARYHVLLKVLSQACVAGFVSWLTQPGERTDAELAAKKQQASYTVTILSRQISVRPELLLSTAPGEAELPLYQWLLPCLINAVTSLRLVPGYDALADGLTAQAVAIVQALGTDLAGGEEGVNFGRGAPRLRLCLSALQQSLSDLTQSPTYPLFLFPAPARESRSQIDSRQFETTIQPLVSSPKLAPSAAIALADVLVAACTTAATVPNSLAFISDVTAETLLCLPRVWSLLKREQDKPLEGELVRIITSALPLGQTSVAQQVIPWSVACFQADPMPGRQWLALSEFFTAVDSPELLLSFFRTVSVPRLVELVSSGDASDPARHAAVCALLFLLRAPYFDHASLEPLRASLELGSHAGKGDAWDKLASHLGVSRGIKRKRDTTYGKPHRDLAIEIVRKQVTIPDMDIVERVVISEGTEAQFIKLVDRWLFEKPIPPESRLAFTTMLSQLYCALACQDSCQQAPVLPPSVLISWASFADHDRMAPPDQLVAILNAELQLLRHAAPSVAGSLDPGKFSPVLQIPWAGVMNKDRRVRLAAGRVLVKIYQMQGTLAVKEMAVVRRQTFFRRVGDVLSGSVKETALMVLGEIGRDEASVPDVLELLLPQLGASSSPVRSLAYAEILAICRHHRKAPYPLILPHIERISILLASHLISAPDIVAETMRLIERTRQNFFETTVRYTLPALVVECDKARLDLLAAIVKQPLGVLLVDHSHLVLAKAFMSPDKTDTALAFLVGVLQSLTRGHGDREVSASSVITTCVIHFLVELVIELGSLDPTTVATAEAALSKAGRIQRGDATDLGTFLKPHMLGVISHMNDVMHDIQGKKTVDAKRKVIRSLGALAQRVGGMMASFSPQIMASLQSTLEIPPLREETLRSWHVFVTALKFGDIGPYVGATTAALVANWDSFTPAERVIAAKTITYLIVDNSGRLVGFMDDVVGMDHIPELRAAAGRLHDLRRSWPFSKQLDKLLDRARSENISVSTRSVAELREFLLSHRAEITDLARGNAFDPLIGQCMRTLLITATRDGERRQALRDLSYECIGILGALDPDRLNVQHENTAMTLLGNFADQEESQDFALHLIRDVLVGAFRSTNDTKHQGHLAYAIQELLKFCGFSPKVLQSSNAAVPLKVLQRWQRLPKDQLETLTPLLEARFTVGEVQVKTFAHPIYPTVSTYREWLQYWTTDLIGKVMSVNVADVVHDRTARAIKDSQAIFGVFRGVLRNQDVSVAHHILPHLVLTVLCSGDAKAKAEITAEINTVLEDQVNPQEGSPDRRSLSAQVVFGLMDHLSRWLLLQRQASSRDKRKEPLNDRKDADLIAVSRHIRTVESVIAAIETELTANAALQSKAYARSLRNFEQRITKLRQQDRPDTELQTYFENLHHIYADLDEPDGMEGISSMILAPTLQTQIREHESTGRWTSAQSCWEVRLQQKPDDVTLHVGLLRCLRNLGHYDTLRTHIRGVLSRYPEWLSELAAFQVEAAWMAGDWGAVQQVVSADVPHSPEVSLARVLLAMRLKDSNLPAILVTARRELGAAISASGRLYPRAYDSVVSLHQLHEVEMIRELESRIDITGTNKAALVASRIQSLTSSLDARFHSTLPSYKVRESMLSMRRTAFGLSAQAALRAETGLAWITSAKIARKAGHEQTAYSATLQARELDAPFAFIQQAKLLHVHGGAFKALADLDHGLRPLLGTSKSGFIDLTGDEKPAGLDRNLAKAVLLEARWAEETKRFSTNEIVLRFRNASELAPTEESPHYHLGHYYDLQCAGMPAENRWAYNQHTCAQYLAALKCGTKYIYQTMPRMLTLWLDMGESKDLLLEAKAVKKGTKASAQGIGNYLRKITSAVDKARQELPEYQWFTAFPQLVSRVGHSNPQVSEVLMSIIARVITRYPQQALWSVVGVLQSKKGDRHKRCTAILAKAANDGGNTKVLIESAQKVAGALLRMCLDNGTETDSKGGRKDISKDRLRLSMAQHFYYVSRCVPSRTILPLQDALTCTLPTSATTVKTHNPFPDAVVEIIGFDDLVEVMPSLQRPKKIVFLGSDGKKYPFLCKPHDDLRKDARLMDFNSMINKLLISASESRRRNLHIRTYAVMPLNEECGLLEWVTHTTALRPILEKAYARQGKKLYSGEIYKAIDEARQGGLPAAAKAFDEVVLPLYKPAVFHEWFLVTWPEPSAWLASRLAYARTLAVMSMIGFVLGLGDRHGENILFDDLTGDTVHVDFNCLFEKGKSFEIPERVPFRLTHNLVDALGVTGVDGVYRKAAEISLEILRNNKDSLMSVLEAFVHDPLVEWEQARQRSRDGKRDIRDFADQSLQPIEGKLRGLVDSRRGLGMSVTNQVEHLIKQATSSANLGAMYQGWASWL